MGSSAYRLAVPTFAVITSRKSLGAGHNKLAGVAAKSPDEIVFCYPGFSAVTVYRMAHELYRLDIPLIPRMMTEYAHGKPLAGICVISTARPTATGVGAASRRRHWASLAARWPLAR